MEVQNDKKLYIKVISFILAMMLAFMTCMPRTNTFLDDFTQPKKAEAVVPLAIPAFGALLAIAGIGVAGTTLVTYNGNVEKAMQDFATWSGTTVSTIETELNNAIGTDGKLMLSMLTTGAVGNILSWSNTLSLNNIDTSLIEIGKAYVKAGAVDIALNITSDDLSGGMKTYKYPIVGALINFDANTYALEFSSSEGLVSIRKNSNGYNVTCSDGGYAINGVIKYSSGKSSVISNGKFDFSLKSAFTFSSLENVTLSNKVNIEIYDDTAKPARQIGIYEGKTGIWHGDQSAYTPANTGAVNGAITGALTGGIAAGGTTLGQLAPSINIWNPSELQLESGYAYPDVIAGTGALEGSSGGESGGGDTDEPSLLNKILAGVLALSGIAALPTIVTGIGNAVTTGFDAFTKWCENVWAWMQSLDLAKWLSNVWGWLSSLNLVTLLSPLAALWEWVSSLGLLNWLTAVWDWIASLDLAGALAGILEGVTNFPNFIRDWFNKPQEKFNWEKLLDPDLLMIFPFCLAWDLYSLVTMLSASATAPYIEVPINTPVGNNTVVIDLSQYDSVAQVLRAVELLAAAIGLIFLTKKFIRN